MLLNFGIMGILAYTYLMLSHWRRGLVGSRWNLTIAGVLGIGLAIVASMGVCSAIGLFYS